MVRAAAGPESRRSSVGVPCAGGRISGSARVDGIIRPEFASPVRLSRLVAVVASPGDIRPLAAGELRAVASLAVLPGASATTTDAGSTVGDVDEPQAGLSHSGAGVCIARQLRVMAAGSRERAPDPRPDGRCATKLCGRRVPVGHGLVRSARGFVFGRGALTGSARSVTIPWFSRWEAGNGSGDSERVDRGQPYG